MGDAGICGMVAAVSGRHNIRNLSFRLSLADDAIASAILGGIEAGIGALNEVVLPVLVTQLRNADRNRQLSENVSRGALDEALVFDTRTNLVGQRDGSPKRSLPEDHGKFLAAVARGGVATLHV